MEWTKLSEHGRQRLAELLARATLPVPELPYTSAFDELYAEFCRVAGAKPTKHEVWTWLLSMGDAAALGADRRPGPVLPALPASDVKAAVPAPAMIRPPAHPNEPSLWDPPPGNGTVIHLQPWSVQKTPPVDDQVGQERRELLAAIAESQLGNTEQRVAYILQRYPETRDSDTALAIRYWTIFQSDVLERWDRLELTVLYNLDRIETISRIRRHIQNDLRLFSATTDVSQYRAVNQMEMNEYLAAHRSIDPEIRFYLDETGNEPGRNYVGVAGVCVMNWRQYEKHWSSITQWRAGRGWPETIHFADAGTALQPKALALMAEMDSRKSGLLFVGYALPYRGRTYEAMAALFIQLIADSLRHIESIGCLGGTRALTVVKEAEPGFDNLYLASMKKSLSEHIAKEFPDRVVLKDIESLPKGREVFLECADLIAGAMQRRAAYSGRNPKDVLAEAVFNVTGFEDPRDKGVVFKAYPI